MMKAVLFDFNGTLFNDTRFHIEAWHNLMKKHFGQELTVDELMKGFIGPSNRSIFERISGGTMPPEEVRKYSLEKEREYRSAVLSKEENKKLIDGVPEMLDMLAERGIPVAMATASPLDNVEFYLKDLGMNRWFTPDRVVYEEGKLASKPDPAFYLEAARRIGMRPQDCIIVEDSPTGLAAAANAHAGRIIAIDGTTPREELEKNPNIHAIIHDFFAFEQFI